MPRGFSLPQTDVIRFAEILIFFSLTLPLQKGADIFREVEASKQPNEVPMRVLCGQHSDLSVHSPGCLREV